MTARLTPGRALRYAKGSARGLLRQALGHYHPLPASPELVELYLTDLAAPASMARALSVASIKRRLAGLSWG